MPEVVPSVPLVTEPHVKFVEPSDGAANPVEPGVTACTVMVWLLVLKLETDTRVSVGTSLLHSQAEVPLEFPLAPFVIAPTRLPVVVLRLDEEVKTPQVFADWLVLRVELEKL